MRARGRCVRLTTNAGVGLLVATALVTSGCGAAKHPTVAVDESGIDPSLVTDFGLLKRPLEATDRLPAAVIRSQQQPVTSPAGRREARLGLLPALARRVSIPGTRLEAWLEPGRHGFCLPLAAVGPGGTAQTGGFGDSCGPPPTSLTATVGGGAYLAAGPPLAPGAAGSPSLATGIVPDQVSTVELVDPHGTTTRLRLAGGIFATRFVSGDRLYAVVGHVRLEINVAQPGGNPVGTTGA